MYNWQPVVNALVHSGYVIVPDCFDPALIAQLRLECLAQSPYFQAAHIGKAQARHHNSTIRSDVTLWLKEPYTPAQKQYLDIMESLRQSLNQALYLGFIFQFIAQAGNLHIRAH